jgi:hypothetical protein
MDRIPSAPIIQGMASESSPDKATPPSPAVVSQRELVAASLLRCPPRGKVTSA